jgi:TetR/AcrR family transcriptional regulator, regulator of cefoperazone and chloramphenicol sensitivity
LEFDTVASGRHNWVGEGSDVAQPDRTDHGGARRPREDGNATRRKIIEVAGALFAEQGYIATSSKEITERAGTNVAAINYHFDGREKLYIAVLEEVDRRLIGLDILADVQASSLTPVEKLGRVIATIVGGISDRSGWPVTLWAREIVSPSPLFAVMLRKGVVPKFDILATIVSEITGITGDSTAVLECIVACLAPCILLASVDRKAATPIRALYGIPRQQLADDLTVFAVAGLNAFSAAYRGPEPTRRRRPSSRRK